MDEIEIFLLARQWRDYDDATRLVFWGATADGVARVVVARDEPVFFVDRDVAAPGRSARARGLARRCAARPSTR